MIGRSIGGTGSKIVLERVDRAKSLAELREALHVRVREQAAAIRRKANHQLCSATHRSDARTSASCAAECLTPPDDSGGSRADLVRSNCLPTHCHLRFQPSVCPHT